MYRVELYAQVRRSVFVEGLSEREAAKRFGLARGPVRKMLRYATPPGYRRRQPAQRPKLDPLTGIVDQILIDDQERPKKQRHTAKRIFDRLRDEYDFTGGYTIVKDYVRDKKLGGQEMFVPLVHPPGDAQADFGEALVVIDGVQRKAHYLVVDLPHSDDAFVKAFPAETTEAFCEGHNAAFRYFGGVPRSILYDNTTLAVARILGDGRRKRTRVFSELQSHYLFSDRFGRPGKGNDKGKVEGLVGYARRNFMVPAPRFPSWEAFNEQLEAQCLNNRKRRLRRHTETIEERFKRDRQALLPLPPTPYDACDKRTTRVTSLSLVRYRANDYSVPTRYGHRQVLLKGYVDEIVICCGSEEIARHRRSYEREELIFDPLHYLALLERKTNALDQAAPLAGWELPEQFTCLRRLLEARLGKPGKREYVQVLRLLEDFRFEHVAAAVRQACELGAIGLDAVRHLVLCRIEQRPPRLDLTKYPHLPAGPAAVWAMRLSGFGDGGHDFPGHAPAAAHLVSDHVVGDQPEKRGERTGTAKHLGSGKLPYRLGVAAQAAARDGAARPRTAQRSRGGRRDLCGGRRRGTARTADAEKSTGSHRRRGRRRGDRKDPYEAHPRSVQATAARLHPRGCRARQHDPHRRLGRVRRPGGAWLSARVRLSGRFEPVGLRAVAPR